MIKVLQKRERSEGEMNVLSIPVHDSLSNPTILHSKQLSQSTLPTSSASLPHHTSPHHAPQLSPPAPFSLAPGSPTRLPASNEFFDGITSSMSSTARGPLTKLSLHRGEERRVRSGSPGVRHRSATPQELRDLLERRAATPTSIAASLAGRSAARRDSAPATGEGTASPNRTLINTSELYTSSSTLHSGGTMPKMSFAPMKEEMSRTLPIKGFNLAEAAARQDQGEEKKEGEERRRRD